MKVDDWTSEDVHTLGGGEFPSSAGLTPNALPEAQSNTNTEGSQTGVSTKNVLFRKTIKRQHLQQHTCRVHFWKKSQTNELFLIE